MNRREVVKGMLALPALGLMGGCQQWFKKDPDRPTTGTKLCVILQGPFGVVLSKGKGYRVTAFVPKTDANDPLQHEFRFRSPTSAPCMAGYRYELLQKGLEITEQEPQVDRGFANVLFSVNKWVPDPDNYFVTLDLPAPDAITYLPPLVPALFDSGHDSGTRLGSVPLNHVLEYRVSNADDLRLRPKESQSCGTGDELKPWPSVKLLEKYKDLHQELRDEAEAPSSSQRPNVPRLLAQYSYVYFFGVGVPPNKKGALNLQDLMKQRVDHGVRFFNERLLPAIYQQGQVIPLGSKLKKLGKEALQCDTLQDDSSSQGIKPSVWQYSMPQPHLQTVASTENCTAPGATAFARS